MKLKDYIRDRFIFIIIKLAIYLMAYFTLTAFQTDKSCKYVVIIGIILTDIFVVLVDFLRKKRFYDSLLKNLEELDKKYLVGETVGEPHFLEGEILLDSLYDINTCMQDELKEMNHSIKEFKDYVEMWIHEIKLPIASLVLMNYNKDVKNPKEVEKLNLLNKYVEQILFYVRSDTPDKDYLLKSVSLQELIQNEIAQQKDLLIGKHIRIQMKDLNVNVYTDSKWMEFILGQVLSNCIKYKDEKKEQSYIEFRTELLEDKIRLYIKDNGIGIDPADVGRVFDKSFTGTNGRIGQNSTGMGLYISKKLCKKLGHQINIASVYGEYTEVMLEFGKNNHYLGYESAK